MSVLYSPKKFKSLRVHKNPKVGVITKKLINNGYYSGVISRGFGHLNWRSIEAGRRSLTRQLKRKIKVQVKIRLTQPVTSKPKQSRMGKGKGKFKGWIGYIRPGTYMYDVGFTTAWAIELSKDINSLNTRKLPLKDIKQKFPFPVQIIEKKYEFIKIKQKNYVNDLGFKKYKKTQFNVINETYTKIDRNEPRPKLKRKKKISKRRKFKKIKTSKKLVKLKEIQKYTFFLKKIIQ